MALKSGRGTAHAEPVEARGGVFQRTVRAERRVRVILRLPEVEMASKVDELEAEALSLPTAERARLVSRLLASLDEQSDEDVELAWIEEAERRYQEVRNDPSAAEPASVAFQRARDAFR
jgi:putative addiction module component (TIGR02574 family)